MWRSFWDGVSSMRKQDKPGYDPEIHWTEVNTPAYRSYLIREFFKRKRMIDKLTGANFWVSLENIIWNLSKNRRYLPLRMHDFLGDLYRKFHPYIAPELSSSARRRQMKNFIRMWIDEPEQDARSHATNVAAGVPLPFADAVDSDDDVVYPRPRRTERHSRLSAARARGVRDDDIYAPCPVRFAGARSNCLNRSDGFSVSDVYDLSRATLISPSAATMFLKWWQWHKYSDDFPDDGSQGPNDSPGRFSAVNPFRLVEAARAVNARRNLPDFAWLWETPRVAPFAAHASTVSFPLSDSDVNHDTNDDARGDEQDDSSGQ